MNTSIDNDSEPDLTESHHSSNESEESNSDHQSLDQDSNESDGLDSMEDDHPSEDTNLPMSVDENGSSSDPSERSLPDDATNQDIVRAYFGEIPLLTPHQPIYHLHHQ